MSIQKALVEHGFFVNFDFFPKDRLSDIEAFFRLPETRPGVVEFKAKDIEDSQSETLKEIYRRIMNIMKDIGESLEFHKLWFQTTNKYSVQAFEAKASPFLPHIDTQRYTKAMLYVTDVNENDGPFTTSKLAPSQFENLRKDICNKVPAKMNYQDDQSEFNPKRTTYYPIIGNRGMLIVFDTNTPHFAGKMNSDNLRKILRFDFWDKRHII